LRRALTSAAAILLCACTYATDEGLRDDWTVGNLSLSRSVPFPGQTDVPLNTNIDLFFDLIPDPSTASQPEVRLFSGPIETLGTITVDLLLRRVRLRPAIDLRADLQHQVFVSAAIGDLTGRSLARDITFSFRTGGSTAAPPPAASSPGAAEIQPIWTRSCASSCHGAARPRAGVDLSSPAAVISSMSGVPNVGATHLLVDPADHARSYLMLKLLGEGGFTGSPMPPSGEQLRHEDLRQIADWIDGGALP
jgi:hypothetical protein